MVRKAPAPVADPAPVTKQEGARVTSGPFKGTIAAPAATTPTVTPKPGMQSDRWARAKVSAKYTLRLDKEVDRWKRTEATYRALQKMRANGVPAYVIYGFHMRESDCSFQRHLHEGSLLKARTVDVPKGRLPNIPPPYTFLVSAEDALYTYEKLERRDWKHLETALQAAESYNGLGYQKKGRISPYMWSGTTIYTGGKYVKDHVFSATAIDAQLGVCAVLKRMQDRGIAVDFK